MSAYENFYLMVPVQRKYVIAGPEDSFANADLETIAKLVQGGNVAGLAGKRITSVILGPASDGNGLAFTFSTEDVNRDSTSGDTPCPTTKT